MRPSGTAILAAILLASVLDGCSPGASSPAATRSGPGAPSPAAATAPPAAGPTSSTGPATVAPPDSTTVELAGPPGHFEPADLTASAGDVAFFLVNTSPGFHTMSIGPALLESVVTSTTIEPGTSAVFAVQGLPAGHYIVWCTISDHAALGMVGTLTVTP